MIYKLSVTILFLFFVVNQSLYGQIILQGTILNSRTKEAIQYANIGIMGANVGTISNPDGSFSLTIPARYLSDTLVFSSIGYEKRSIALANLSDKQSFVIYLTEKVMELKPVIIGNRKVKSGSFQLGNPDFNGGVLETDTIYAGRSVALLIDDKSTSNKSNLSFPAYLESARLRIFRNNLGSFKFRIRLNSVDPVTGQPADDMLNENIVMGSTMRKGWLVFDLSKLNIEIAEPFYLTFEQILDKTDRTAIANEYREFAAKHPERIKTDTIDVNGVKEARTKFGRAGIDLAGTFISIANTGSTAGKFTCFIKQTSFGEWKKVSGIIAATVTCSK